MRSRIKVNGLWYRPVPWFAEGGAECTGCAFERNGCINTEDRDNPCDEGQEFDSQIFIRYTKEAYENYLTQQVLHKFDNAS